jgi:multisubunit Na+/H+ antiporter MnhB subunit
MSNAAVSGIAARTRQAAPMVAHPLFPPVSGALLFVLYLAIAWFVLPPDAVWSPDEGAKWLQTHSLRVSDGRFRYDIPYTGRDVDPDLSFALTDSPRELLSIQEASLYLRRIPLFPLLTQPLYAGLGPRGLYVLPALGGALICTLTLLLLAPAQRRLATWLLLAFGSPVLIYATLFWEHTLAASFGMAAALLALRAGKLKSMRSALAWSSAGLLLALGVYLRPEMALFAAVLLVAAGLVRRQARGGVALAAAVLGLAVLAYLPMQAALFGQAVPTNARYLVRPLQYLEGAQWRAVPDLLVGPAADEALDTGWLGGLWAIAAVTAAAHGLGRTKSRGAGRNIQWIALAITAVVGAACLFTASDYRAAHGLLFSTPWVLLGVCRLRAMWQRGDEPSRVLALTLALGLIGYAVAMLAVRGSAPHGGLEWGARFALPFFPLLALSALGNNPHRRYAASAASTRWAALAVTASLLFLGFAFQARGLWTIRRDKQISAALNQALAATPESYVLSDLWWLSLNAAPLYPHKAFAVADQPDRAAAWVERAASAQVRSIILVTLNPSLPEALTRALTGHSLQVMSLERVDNVLVYRIAIDP